MEYGDAICQLIEWSARYRDSLLNNEELPELKKPEAVLRALNRESYQRVLERDDYDSRELLIAELLDSFLCVLYDDESSIEILHRIHLSRREGGDGLSNRVSVNQIVGSLREKFKNISPDPLQAKIDAEYEVYFNHIMDRYRNGGQPRKPPMSRDKWKPHLKTEYSCFNEYHPDPSAKWWKLKFVDIKFMDLKAAVGGRFRTEFNKFAKISDDKPPVAGARTFDELLYSWIRSKKKKVDFIHDFLEAQRNLAIREIDGIRMLVANPDYQPRQSTLESDWQDYMYGLGLLLDTVHGVLGKLDLERILNDEELKLEKIQRYKAELDGLTASENFSNYLFSKDHDLLKGEDFPYIL